MGSLGNVIVRLRRSSGFDIDAYVANRLRGPARTAAERSWRAHFVTELRVQKLWPPDYRDRP